jgi:hypothetical protein
MRIKLSRLLAASAILAMTAAPASAATVIYQDDFSGGTGDLNGLAPDIGANNWVAMSEFNANGSFLDEGGAGSGGGSATLAFTPVDGLIYTLDVSLNQVIGDANWIGVGFAEGQSSLDTANNRFLNQAASGTDWTLGKAWMFIRGDNSTFNNHSFLGINDGGVNAGNRDSVDTPATFNETAVDLRIVLDTTDGAGAWTATWFAKLPVDAAYTEVRPEAVLLDENITSVGLVKSADDVTGSVTSFSLTVVPEPATSVMALVGLGALAMRHRRG